MRTAVAHHELPSPETRVDLEDAREALAYWEDRSQRLPRHAVRRRREATDMARRWHARVTEAERAHYGRGLLGAFLLVVAEGRLPQATRRTGRRLVKRARRAALVVAGAFGIMALAVVVAAVELLLAVAHAIA